MARGAAYARLARATGLGPFDPADLADPGGDRPLPALVSTGVRTRFGTAPMVLQPEFGQLVVEPAVVRRDTPAQPGGDFVVVDARGVQRRHPDTYADPATGPSVAPLAGRSLDPGALRTALRNNSPTALTTGLTLRSAVRAQFADSPLHQGAERLYAAAVAAGTGFALLALSLALLQTAPERTGLLTGLRALGLPPAQGRRLLVLEALPQAVLAAAPVPTAPVRLDADPASLVLPSLADLEHRATAHRGRPSYGHDALIACDRLVRVFTTDGVEVQALQGLDLLVAEGELLALVGASGSGKSTLMNILAGLDVPTAGAARVAGRDLLTMDARTRLDYRRNVVGFVWQQTSRNLLPYLTALQNVTLPMHLRGGRRRAARTEAAEELLSLLSLTHCRDRRPHQLSGGEAQRTTIAVALANSPAVLLADEPTGELDSHTAEQVFAAFRTANEELGTTIVIVTHDQKVAAEVPHRRHPRRTHRVGGPAPHRDRRRDRSGVRRGPGVRHPRPGRPAPTPHRLHRAPGHAGPRPAATGGRPHRRPARRPGDGRRRRRAAPVRTGCATGAGGRAGGPPPRLTPTHRQTGVTVRPDSPADPVDPPARTATEPYGVLSRSHPPAANSAGAGAWAPTGPAAPDPAPPATAARGVAPALPEAASAPARAPRRKPSACAACTARSGSSVSPSVRDQISRPMRSRSLRVRRCGGSASSRARNSATAADTARTSASGVGSPGTRAQPPRGGSTPAHGGPVTAAGTVTPPVVSATPSRSSPADTVTSRSRPPPGPRPVRASAATGPPPASTTPSSASRAVRIASTSKDGGRPKTASTPPPTWSRTAAPRS